MYVKLRGMRRSLPCNTKEVAAYRKDSTAKGSGLLTLSR